jgi:hypothetical protein
MDPATFYATVYSETGTQSDLAVYHDAYRNATIVTIAFVVAALVFALLDARARRLSGVR